MALIDTYREGYELGVTHAQAGERRRANWELVATSPKHWVPFLFDSEAYYQGYVKGYEDVCGTTTFLNRFR